MNQAIQTVLADPSILNAAVFCVAAVAGQSAHAIKKWAEGEAWVLANAKRTIAAILGNLGGMAAFISTGALDDMKKTATVIALGLFMGFSADSAINKGSRAAWTDEERAKKVGE